jgi:hypothetical protein
VALLFAGAMIRAMTSSSVGLKRRAGVIVDAHLVAGVMRKDFHRCSGAAGAEFREWRLWPAPLRDAWPHAHAFESGAA